MSFFKKKSLLALMVIGMVFLVGCSNGFGGADDEFVGSSSLTVSVLDEEGNSISAEVSILENGNVEYSETGELVEFDLENGEYTVKAEKDGYITSEKEVVLTEDTSVEIKLVKLENMLGNESFEDDFLLRENVSENGDGNFDTKNNWLYLQNAGESSASIDEGMFRIDIDDPGNDTFSHQLLQAPLTIEQGYKYRVEFDVKASEGRDIEVKVGGTGDRGWTSYNSDAGETGESDGYLVELTEELNSYEFEFVMTEETDDLARFEFQLGAETPSVWIDNVRLYKIGESDVDETPTTETEWVYDDEFFFIFNVAVGGHWPGYPDEATEFPTSMEVDYIKVFDQAGNLEWEDQFDGNDINEDYWTFEVGNGHEQGIPGWGNEELQYYTDGDNARIENDRLIIEAREEERSDEFGSYDYTSTRMITQSKVSMEYGRVEISAKLPDGGQGIWPALWMLGEDIDEVGWPQCGEIDIMEFLGQNPDEVHGTVHGPGHYAGAGIGSNYILPEGDFTEGFNTFILEWEEDEMRWYVNDELFHAIERTENNGVRKDR